MKREISSSKIISEKLTTFYTAILIIIIIPVFVMNLTNTMVVVICLILIFPAMKMFYLTPSKNYKLLMKKVDIYKAENNTEIKWEVDDAKNYLGFDKKNQKVLFISLEDNIETYVPFRKVKYWVFEQHRSKLFDLKIFTTDENASLVIVMLYKVERDIWEANLNVIFEAIEDDE